MSEHMCCILMQDVCWTEHVPVRTVGPVTNVTLSVRAEPKHHVAGMAHAARMENASVKGAGPVGTAASNVRVPKTILITGHVIITVIAMDGSSTRGRSCTSA